MSDVFISYSRKNSDFAHKLDSALTAAKRDVWIDWQDIARGEDWWHSIQTGIDSADTTLIIITENWLVSEVCHRELEYVRKQNKRVFPIIREKVEGDLAIRVKGTWVDQEWEQRARDNWKYLRSVNWLYFDDDTAFDAAFKDLLTALDTDQVYVKSHTRYLVRALEWQQSSRDSSFLLEGDQLEAAQAWLKTSVNKTPEPLPTHHEYVTASDIAEKVRIARDKAREQLIRRFRQSAIILGAAVAVAIIAAVVIGQQYISARAEVTSAGATLQQVNMLVTAAVNQQVTAAAKVQAAEYQVATATIEQGNA
ncbi:MAG: toll/interleukin-1 receptor domain-containing protein, partial [Chloroflexota bacterium]